MEGDGEGLLTILQRLDDDGTVLTVVRRQKDLQSGKSGLKVDSAHLSAPKTVHQVKDFKVQTSTQSPVNGVDTSTQICDDRYASCYQVSHCSTIPSSPPISSSEFPPQRNSPTYMDGHFASYGSELGHHKTKSSHHREGLTRFGRGSLHSSRSTRDMDAFAHSLRKYPRPAPSRTVSSELLEKLLKQSKTKSPPNPSRTRSMRSLQKHKSIEHTPRTHRHIQTYTRQVTHTNVPDVKPNDVDDVKDGTDDGTKRKDRKDGLKSAVNDGDNVSRKESPITMTYDYLKVNSCRPSRSEREVRLRQLNEYVQSAIRQVYQQPPAVFQVRQKTQKRYKNYKKSRFTEVTNEKKSTDSQLKDNPTDVYQNSKVTAMRFENKIRVKSISFSEPQDDIFNTFIRDSNENRDSIPTLFPEVKDEIAKGFREVINKADLAKDKKLELKNILIDIIDEYSDELQLHPKESNRIDAKKHVMRDVKKALNNTSIPKKARDELKRRLSEVMNKVMNIFPLEAKDLISSPNHKDKLSRQTHSFLDLLPVPTHIREDLKGKVSYLIPIVLEEAVSSQRRLSTLPRIDSYVRESAGVHDVPVKKEPILVENSLKKRRKSKDYGSSLSTEEKQCWTDLAAVIGTWIDELPLELDDRTKRGVKAEIADDIIHRQKFLQLNPNAKTTLQQELLHLQYQVFKRLDKVLDDNDMKTLMKKADDLLNTMRSVNCPRSLGGNPKPKVHGDEILKKIERVINEWMKQLPSKLKTAEEWFEFNKKADILAKKLKDIGQHDHTHTEMKHKMKTEITSFLHRLPLQDKHVHFAQDLVDKLISKQLVGKIDDQKKLPAKPPCCTLSSEDKAHLERIRQRTCLAPGCLNSLMNVDSKANAKPVKSNDSEINLACPNVRNSCTSFARRPSRRFAQRPCPRLAQRTCSTYDQGPCSRATLVPSRPISPTRIQRYPCLQSSSKLEIQPQVIIKEYYWEPDEYLEEEIEPISCQGQPLFKSRGVSCNKPTICPHCIQQRSSVSCQDGSRVSLTYTASPHSPRSSRNCSPRVKRSPYTPAPPSGKDTRKLRQKKPVHRNTSPMHCKTEKISEGFRKSSSSVHGFHDNASNFVARDGYKFRMKPCNSRKYVQSQCHVRARWFPDDDEVSNCSKSCGIQCPYPSNLYFR